MLSVLLHLQYAITACGQVGIVSDDDRRQTAFAVALPHQLENFLARGEVEIARWLVREKQHWVGEKSSRNGHSLLLSAGELIRIVTAASFQSELGQELAGVA